jgi:hypothetical protein
MGVRVAVGSGVFVGKIVVGVALGGMGVTVGSVLPQPALTSRTVSTAMSDLVDMRLSLQSSQGLSKRVRLFQFLWKARNRYVLARVHVQRRVSEFLPFLGLPWSTSVFTFVSPFS